MSLKKFEKNIRSQYGEDGVIDEIFSRIGNNNKIAVEFGAWDGEHLSNTWDLWKNKDWYSYLIEGDSKKAKELEKNLIPFKKTTSIHSYVTEEGENSLDVILSKFPIPKDFDLLSIDIDGDEFYILEGLNNYKPKLIIIEYNPTVPPYVEMVQAKGEYLGSSSFSLIKLGEMKGYKPIHVTNTNLFLLSNDIFELGNFELLDLNIQYKNPNLVNVITSYDGISFLSANLPYKQNLPTKKDITVKSFLKSLIKKTTNPQEPKFNIPKSFLPVEILKKNK